MKTMTSKFAGVCRVCKTSVPTGALIIYHGRGCGISCAKCAGISAPTPVSEQRAPCWDCRAPDGRLRNYGAATPCLCDGCEAKRRTADRKRFQPDRFDMDYEDRCAAACGL